MTPDELNRIALYKHAEQLDKELTQLQVNEHKYLKTIEKLTARVKELENKNREIKYLFAEMSGAIIGLLLHPSDKPLNGCLISEGSKEKIRELKKSVESYEQL